MAAKCWETSENKGVRTGWALNPGLTLSLKCRPGLVPAGRLGVQLRARSRWFVLRYSHPGRLPVALWRQRPLWSLRPRRSWITSAWEYPGYHISVASPGCHLYSVWQSAPCRRTRRPATPLGPIINQDRLIGLQNFLLKRIIADVNNIFRHLLLTWVFPEGTWKGYDSVTIRTCGILIFSCHLGLLYRTAQLTARYFRPTQQFYQNSTQRIKDQLSIRGRLRLLLH